MEIVPSSRVGGLTIISTIDVYDSPQERMPFYPQNVEDFDAFFLSLDRHAVIRRDFVLFSRIDIWVKKSRDSWVSVRSHARDFVGTGAGSR